MLMTFMGRARRPLRFGMSLRWPKLVFNDGMRGGQVFRLTLARTTLPYRLRVASGACDP